GNQSSFSAGSGGTALPGVSTTESPYGGNVTSLTDKTGGLGKNRVLVACL
ncbi:hypothetical protein GJ496_000289, partial [Pomphorhynchus laevis]